MGINDHPRRSQTLEDVVQPRQERLRRADENESTPREALVEILGLINHAMPSGLYHQTITVTQHGPWYQNSKGSHERSFDAQ